MRDFTLAGFLAHISAMAAKMHREMHHALERAAVVVETEAKAELGTYQDQAGPFAGWAELADSTKADRVAQGYTENEPGLRSGEMRDGIGHHVEMTGVMTGEAQIGSNDDKMLWFELGTANQPPRSALGGALVRKSDEVTKIIGHGAVKGLVGEGVAGGFLPIP